MKNGEAVVKAVAVGGEGASATLDLIDMDTPVAGEHQVLVKVFASGLNRADLRRTRQHFKQSVGPQIAGLEFAGEVVEVGPGAVGVQRGDRVAAMAPNAYAEYALADARTLLSVPDNVDWPEAAAIPTWYMTAHNALVTEGGFAAGMSVLVTAAPSGVGIATIQIARLLGAQRIVGTSSSRSKADRLNQIGLTDLVEPSDMPLGERVRELTGGKGAEIVIDMVGSGLLGELVDAVALGGRIISVGRMGGFTDTIDLDKLALKRLRLTGVTFRTLDVAGKSNLRDATLRDLGAALSSGALRPIVDRTFPLSEASAAQDYMKENRHFGKVVLIP